MRARQALSIVREIISFDMLCCFKTILNTRPDVLQLPGSSLSHSGALGLHHQSGQIPLLEGQVTVRESLSLPIGTAPVGKGQQCLLLIQHLGTKQTIHSWIVGPGTSQTCAAATTMPFAESLTPTAQCVLIHRPNAQAGNPPHALLPDEPLYQPQPSILCAWQALQE